MDDRLLVTASPHIRDNTTTAGLMGWVLAALAPCAVAATILFGWRALLLIAVTVFACVAFEYLWCLLLKKPIPVGDLSACVTGVILAMNMPVGMPLWIAVIGAFVAIIITKQLWGGIGFNFANPALVGRIVLFLGFAPRMTAYVYPAAASDALAGATPLAASVDRSAVSLLDVFLGVHGGMLGETCALACLAGLAILLYAGVIDAWIPCSILGSAFVFTLLITGSLHVALVELCSGGLLFGAVFMATDYVTSPLTAKGKLIYGVFIGLVTVLIRHFGGMNEGMSFAILLGNIITCLLNQYVHQTPLGWRKPQKAKKAAAEKEPAAAQGGAR